MTTDDNPARDRAVRVLTHYIELLFARTGRALEADCRAELAGLVDDVIEAATLHATAERSGRAGGRRR